MSRETLIAVFLGVMAVVAALWLVGASTSKCHVVGWIGGMPIQQCPVEEVPPELREIGPDRAGEDAK